MLKLKAPIRSAYVPDIRMGERGLDKKIPSNYTLAGAKIDAEELLYLLASEPEEPEEQQPGQINVFSDTKNDLNFRISVVNNLIARAAATDIENITYQDEVFISTMLRKLGISDEREFITILREQKSADAATRALLERVRTRVESVRGEETAETAVRENIPAAGQTAGRTESAPEQRLYLHESVYKRLGTEAVYKSVASYFAPLFSETSEVTNRELRVAEQTATADRIELQRLRDRMTESERVVAEKLLETRELPITGEVPARPDAKFVPAASRALMSAITNVYSSVSRTRGGDVVNIAELNRSAVNSTKTSVAKYNTDVETLQYVYNEGFTEVEENTEEASAITSESFASALTNVFESHISGAGKKLETLVERVDRVLAGVSAPSELAETVRTEVERSISRETRERESVLTRETEKSAQPETGAAPVGRGVESAAKAELVYGERAASEREPTESEMAESAPGAGAAEREILMRERETRESTERTLRETAERERSATLRETETERTFAAGAERVETERETVRERAGEPGTLRETEIVYGEPAKQQEPESGAERQTELRTERRDSSSYERETERETTRERETASDTELRTEARERELRTEREKLQTVDTRESVRQVSEKAAETPRAQVEYAERGAEAVGGGAEAPETEKVRVDSAPSVGAARTAENIIKQLTERAAGAAAVRTPPEKVGTERAEGPARESASSQETAETVYAEGGTVSSETETVRTESSETATEREKVTAERESQLVTERLAQFLERERETKRTESSRTESILRATLASLAGNREETLPEQNIGNAVPEIPRTGEIVYRFDEAGNIIAEYPESGEAAGTTLPQAVSEPNGGARAAKSAQAQAETGTQNTSNEFIYNESAAEIERQNTELRETIERLTGASAQPGEQAGSPARQTPEAVPQSLAGMTRDEAQAALGARLAAAMRGEAPPITELEHRETPEQSEQERQAVQLARLLVENPRAALESGLLKTGTQEALASEFGAMNQANRRAAEMVQLERESETVVVDRPPETVVLEVPAQPEEPELPPRIRRRAAPPPEVAKNAEPVNLVYAEELREEQRRQEREEAAAQAEMRRQTQPQPVEYVERNETARTVTVENNAVEDYRTVMNTNENIAEMLTNTVNRQINTIADKVYSNIEKRLKNERARRGF